MMAGLQDLEAQKAARWAKADRYSQGYADNGMSQALTMYYTRYFPFIVLGTPLLAIGIAFLSAWGSPVDWGFAAWMSTQFFAVGSFIGGLVYNAKRLKPRVELGSTMSITVPLEKDEERGLIRGINGKQPVPDEHLTIARSLAVQWRKNNATMLLTVPAYTYIFGLAFTTPSTFGWFYLVMLAFIIAMLVFLTTSFRRHGRFLATTAPRTSTKRP